MRHFHTVLFLFLSLQLQSQNLKPYLQTPTGSSIWVTWKTATGNESTVIYGLSPDALDNTSTGDAQSLVANYIWHKTKLTGLQPNTPYFYQTITGNDSSAVQRFKTQPTKGTATGHYRFIIAGDHQRHDDPTTDLRYKRLIDAARAKAEELFGSPVEDHINMVLNAGDQVDSGTLDQYENLHVNQSQGLCQNVPFMTVIGNHEYSGDQNLANYFAHFIYDETDFHYQQLSGSDGENYYAFQIANIVFVMMNSNVSWQNQTDWVSSVIGTADGDDSVDWIFSDCHHPVYAEQLTNDASPYMLNTIMPILQGSEKMAMYISGHAHLYARGTMHDHPVYHIINGGASWDQYWGQYGGEADHEDVQKTIERQIFQIVDLDLDAREMHVQTYSIGTTLGNGFNEDKLIDDYYLKLDASGPDQPTLASLPAQVTLPHSFSGNAYSGDEPMNSTEFQFAGSNGDFSSPVFHLKRDFENIFQSTGAPLFEPIDQNVGVDIFEMTAEPGQLPKGINYMRVRYRDQAMHWVGVVGPYAV